LPKIKGLNFLGYWDFKFDPILNSGKGQKEKTELPKFLIF
jgi:hypothetical protein